MKSKRNFICEATGTNCTDPECTLGCCMIEVDELIAALTPEQLEKFLGKARAMALAGKNKSG